MDQPSRTRQPVAAAGRSLAYAVAAVAAVDQLTKVFATLIGPTAGVEPTQNTALSLQTADPAGWLEVLLMAAGLVVVLVIVVPRVTGGRVPVWAAAGLIAGAASNLADRAVLGGVRDFLVIGPVVVNVADVAVVFGLAGCAAALRTRPQPITASPGRGGEIPC